MDIVICRVFGRPKQTAGQHECEILGTGPEAAESETRWKQCEKNPGHEEFISAKDFEDNYLPRVQTDRNRDELRAILDLTVRLRVNWTSPGRPDEDKLSIYRGTDRFRLGTGFIRYVNVDNQHCPCNICDGTVSRKFWVFKVHTAHHIVYNAEEAKETRVDFFYDDENCIMESVRARGLGWFNPAIDVCEMLCVTHNEMLGERIESAYHRWRNHFTSPFPDLNLPPSCERNCAAALIVSHPHGQPKKITVGKVRFLKGSSLKYNTATCPGSSGAPVFVFNPNLKDIRDILWTSPVHSGSFTKTSADYMHQLSLLERLLHKLTGRETTLGQLNYGNAWFRKF